MSASFNLNLAETIIVFIGVQFAGYATSRSIDTMQIGDNYRLLVLWVVTLIILIPVLIIKKRHTKMSEKQINQLATKIATETTKRIRRLNESELIEQQERERLIT